MANKNKSEYRLFEVVVGFATIVGVFFTIFGPFQSHWTPYGPEISTTFSVMPNKKIQIISSDKPVNQPYQLRYKIKNSGRKPISQDDYSKRIMLDFGSSHNILDVRPTLTRGNQLLEEDLQYQKYSSILSIIHEKPFYPGRFFEFYITVDSADDGTSEPKIPKPKAEIKGANSDEMRQFFPTRRKISRVLVGLTLISFIIFKFIKPNPLGVPITIFFLLITVLSFFW